MITLAEVDTVLRSAQPILAVTLYPAAGLLALVFGSEAHRLGADTQHDLADYFPPEAESLPPARERRRLRRAPSDTPIADEVAALSMSDETAHRIARRWLWEIAAEEQGKAGIHWASSDGSCWADCPGCARDLTGAFPVVRAA